MFFELVPPLVQILTSETFKNFVQAKLAQSTSLDKKIKARSSEYRSALKDHFRDGKLTIVLGAGVSTVHNLPLWSTLINELLLNYFLSTKKENDQSNLYEKLSMVYGKIFAPSPLVTAKYLQTQMSPGAFNRSVHAALYNNESFNKDAPVYQHIARMATRRGTKVNLRSNLDSIINYNLDDTVERFLRQWDGKFKWQVLHPGSPVEEQGKFSIIHPHGYLPRNSRRPERNRIILAEPEYHDQYTQAYSWSNLAQLIKLVQNTCLFAGLSGVDPNLRRLLDIAVRTRGTKEVRHFIIMRKRTLDEINESIDAYFRTALGPESKDSVESDQLARLLIPVMQRFEEDDYASFGLGVIWIENFQTEIPEVLESIYS